MKQVYDKSWFIRQTRPSFKTEGRHTGFEPNTTLLTRWKAALPIMATRTAAIILLLIGLWTTAANANNNEPPNPIDHIKNYVKHSDKPVTAYSITEHIEGLMATTFGAATQFNTGFTGGNYAMSIKALSATTFVIAYKDSGDNNNGTAIIGTVSGTSLTFGSESVFNVTGGSPYATQNISVVPLSATSFVVTYENADMFSGSDGGATKVGTVSGTGAGATISFGAEALFESSDVENVSATALSATAFVVTYTDYGNSGSGTAIVGTVSGTTITYGSEYVYNAAFTGQISITALSATAFVVAYLDSGNSDYGTAIVGTVSGTTISYGSEYVYNAAFTANNSITALSATAFVVSYIDNGNSGYGTAIVGTVSGTTITYGSESVYNAANTSQYSGGTTAMNSTQFVVAYQEGTGGQEGRAIIGTVSGTGAGASIAYGAEETINAPGLLIVATALRSDIIGPPTTNATHYVTAYTDFSNGDAKVGDATADVSSTAQLNNYLNFDGVDDFITATQQVTVKDNFTMEFWAYPTETITLSAQGPYGFGGLSGQRYVIYPTPSPNAGAGVSVGTNGVCVAEHGPGYLPTVLTWAGSINDWTHIAVVYTNKVPTLYINGVLVATGVSGNSIEAYASTTSFGGGQYGYFGGYLDELRIWDNALSAATILANKDVELTGTEAGLLDYYNFNQGIGGSNNAGVTTLVDATNPTNNGTLTNFTLDGCTSNWLTTSSSPPSVAIVSDDLDNSISVGTSVTFTATPTDGGATPSYQWKKNGVNVGTDSDTYTDVTLNNGNVITVQMTSSLGCQLPVTSNGITMTVITPNNYLNFDGVDDNITAVQQTTVANNFTIEFWAYPTETIALPAEATSGISAISGQRFVNSPAANGGNNSNAGVSVGTNGVCVAEHGGGYLPVILTWPGTITGWTHIAIVYTNKTPSLYINGVLTHTGLQSPKDNVYPATNNYGGGLGFFGGYLDELRIWDNALSGATILANKDVELIGNEAGLLDYYNFNQGIGGGNNAAFTTLLDATSPANNGTLTNFTLNGCTSNWLTTPASPPSVAIVSDDADNNILYGTSVTFTATPTDGGATPSYQWKKNGVNVGTDSDTYTDATLLDGDAITVQMTSSLGCLPPVTSNSIVMIVPFNDDLADAIDATGALPFSHTILSGQAVTATVETNENICGIVAPSWWYKFTPTQNGTGTLISEVTGSTSANNQDDIILGFYTGTTFPLTQVSCQNINNGAGNGESVTINLIANTTYYLQVLPLNQNTILDVTTSFSFVPATPPANDDLANAIDATGALPFSHTVLSSEADDATDETNEAVCYSNSTWWYKFTPTQNGTATITSEVTGSTIGNNTNDVVIGFYLGTTFPLIPAGCQNLNNIAGRGESVTINLTANTTYYLQVSPLNQYTILDVTTSISFVVATPPANDDLANAIDATGALPFSHTVLSAEADDATVETNENICSRNFAWWYKVTPTQNGTMSVTAEVTGSTIDNDEDDIRLGIYTGTTFPLTEIICTDNDNGAGYGENETINVTAGVTYYIRIAPSNEDIILDVTTSISFVVATPPANDDLANAIDATGALPFSHTVISAEADDATIEIDENICKVAAASWWYKFTPTQNGNMTVVSEVTGSTINNAPDNLLLGIYTGTTFPLTEVSCQDNNNGAGYGESETISVTANITYYIKVATSFPQIILDATTSISFVVATPPANDDLANAIDATGALPFSHTVLSAEADDATVETNEAVCQDATVSWWYKVTPTQNDSMTITSEVTGTTINNSTTDLRLSVYTGTTFPLTEIICTDNDNGAGYGENETINLTAGVTYYIRIAPSYEDYVLDVTTSISAVAVLPVELISFTATAQDNRTNLLSWQTASEENNEGFDIERSADGKNWETLGFVKGNGTSLEVFNYNFIDKNPINGINYYRLKQMDFDGQFEYSKIVNVNLFSTNNTITIYPNPVKDELTVTNTENIENVAIYNALGQVVKQFAVNAEQLQINVSDLQEGIYTLRLQNKNGTMITKQFVK